MRGSFAMIELELSILSFQRYLFVKNFVLVIFYENHIFLLLSSRKYDFRGFLGVNFVVTVFYPNSFLHVTSPILKRINGTAMVRGNVLASLRTSRQAFHGRIRRLRT